MKYEILHSDENGVILKLPSGKELYLSETPIGHKNKGETLLDLHIQDTDWDVIRLKRTKNKNRTNAIGIILGYDFEELT